METTSRPLGKHCQAEGCTWRVGINIFDEIDGCGISRMMEPVWSSYTWEEKEAFMADYRRLCTWGHL